MIRESPTVAWNRYVDITRANKRKAETNFIAKLPEAFRYVGISEFRFLALPELLQKKVERTILRGYSLTRNGNAYQFAHALGMVNDWAIGYICRSHTNVWIPVSKAHKATDIEHDLTTLCKLTGKVQDLQVYGSDNGRYVKAVAHSRWYYNYETGKTEGDTTTDSPRFLEFKKYVDKLMLETRPERKKIMDRIKSGEVQRISFQFD